LTCADSEPSGEPLPLPFPVPFDSPDEAVAVELVMFTEFPLA
jgi:hypothetical protein